MLGLPFRFLLFIALVTFCFLPGKLLFSSGLDQTLLTMLSRINGAPVGPAQIGIVVVPDATVERWQADFYNTDELSSLLSNIIHSSDAAIGVLLDSPLDSHATIVDKQLASAGDDNAQQILDKKRYLNTLLNDPRIVLGSLAKQRDVSPSLSFNPEEDVKKGLVYVRSWYSDCKLCDGEAAFDFDGDWYFEPENTSIFQSIWLPNKKGYSPTFLAALIASAHDEPWVDQASDFDLSQSVLMPSLERAGDLDSPLGYFFSAHSEKTNLAPKIIQLSLDEGLLVSAFPPFVLIVSDENVALANEKASALYSVINRRTIGVPWWGEPSARAIILVFFIYLLCWHFRIRSARRRLMALLFWVATLFAGVTIASLRFNVWLPFSAILYIGAVLFLALSVWQFSRNQRIKRERELAQVIDRVGYLLEGNKQYGEALSLFAHHPKTRLGVEKMCHMANRMQEEDTPLKQVIALVDSSLPLVDYDDELVSKAASLRRTLASGPDLASTHKRAQVLSSLIPKTLGRYQIEREIGRGSVGVVYLGFDPAISRAVAIKTMDARQFSEGQHESLQARFFREAEAAGRLNHPNIVSVFDVGEQGDLAFIAMDYVEGVALSDHARVNTLLPVSVVFRLIHDVAVALSYAHENQIIHRDIKPGNIMYGAEPYTLKVADFGIARLLDNSKTSTGEILGSPLYMAPEQLRGSKVGPSADVFSLGVTFYQLLSGELPFKADNLASLTYEIIHTKHKGVRSVRKDLPASATRIINQCLQKQADDRYESAQELAGVLRKALRRDFPTEAKRWGLL